MSDLNTRLSMTVASPISHLSDERAGNVVFFRQMAVATPSGVASVPVISGNSLRGKLRRVAVKRLLADLDVPQGKLPLPLYHFLFSGGSIAKGDTKSALPVTQINALRAELPLLGLWGGCWGGAVLPGALRVGWVWPVCAETAHLTTIPSETPAHTLLTNAYFTRRDDGEAEQVDPDAAPQQMIFEAEILVAGTRLVGKIQTERSTEVESSFLGAVLADWLARPTLGGQLSRGMGEVAVDPVELPSAEPYLQHLAVRRDSMREALRGMGASL